MTVKLKLRKILKELASIFILTIVVSSLSACGKSNLKFSDEDTVQLSLRENTLSPTGAEFILKTDEFIKYGEKFIIEIQLDGKWYSIDEEFDWHAIECTMQAGTEQALEIDWSSRYGRLPTGNYRFIKPITVSGTEKYLCCQFEL